jgi:hypothetical protein
MDKKLNAIEKEILDATKEFALSNGIHYDEMTRNLVLNGIREYAARTTEQKEQLPKGLYPKFLEVYSNFHKERLGMPIKMDLAQGSHLKKIIKYLVGASKEKSEDGALLAWQYILSNWDSLGSYLKNQIKINQINSNLPNILNQLKNGVTSKTNKHSSNSRNEAKQYLANALSNKSGE